MEIPLNKLIELRRDIHRQPELANSEVKTAKRIIEFVKQYSPDKIIENLGGHGLAVIFEGERKGKTIVIRSDMDALPIIEENKFSYKSINENISHKCGHDGHITMAAGLAPLLNQTKLKSGRAVLLFQPAEETGEGAAQILSDEKFDSIKPDYIFGLHNLPGFPKGKIILRNDHFAAASKGMIVKLKGKTSHAAEPQNGISPAKAVSQIIEFILSIKKENVFKDFVLATIVFSQLGESAAFGTSPGYAEIMTTLRSARNDDMETLTKVISDEAEKIAVNENLKSEICWTEEFPATINDNECVSMVEKAAGKNNYDLEFVEEPFRWSEDFGHFTNKFKGAFFGLGSGVDQPQLHNPDYDFPEEILEHGIKMFYELIQSLTEGE